MSTSAYPTINPSLPGGGLSRPPGVITGPQPVGTPANDLIRRRLARRIAENAARRLGYIGAAYSLFELYRWLRNRKEGAVDLTPGSPCPTKTGVGHFTNWYHPTFKPCAINQAVSPMPIEALPTVSPYYIEWTAADEFGHYDMAQHYDNPAYPNAPENQPAEEPIYDPYIHPGYDPYPNPAPGAVPSPVAPPVPIPTTFPQHPDLPRQPTRGPAKNPDPLVNPAFPPVPAIVNPPAPYTPPAVEFTPDAPPVPLAPPTGNPSPPGPGVKERKSKFSGSAWYQLFDTILHYYTETQDFIRAFYNALPDALQNCHHFDSQCQLEQLYDNIEELDVNEALLNLVQNEVEDTIIGALNSALADGYIDQDRYHELVQLRTSLRELLEAQGKLQTESENNA